MAVESILITSDATLTLAAAVTQPDRPFSKHRDRVTDVDVSAFRAWQPGIHQRYSRNTTLSSSIQLVREAPVQPRFTSGLVMPRFNRFVQHVRTAATETHNLFAQALAGGGHELDLASVPQLITMRDRVW